MFFLFRGSFVTSVGQTSRAVQGVVFELIPAKAVSSFTSGLGGPHEIRGSTITGRGHNTIKASTPA